MCVSIHLSSPLSRGLYHRAIGLSGVTISQTKLSSDNLAATRKLAASVGCTITSISKMMDCLRTVPWENIIHNNATQSHQNIPHFSYDLSDLMGFSAVIEKDFGQERFLVEDPFDAFKNARFHRVPTISGTVSDESAGNALSKYERRMNIMYLIFKLNFQ